MDTERSALSTLWDMLVAPRAAFDELAARPRWVAAYVATCVLGVIGAVLQIPVQTHVGLAMIAREAATNPRVAALSPSQLNAMRSATTTTQHYLWAAYPIIVIISFAIAAGLLFAAAKIGRSETTFSRCFALAANVGIIGFGLFYLTLGALCSLHAPDAFSSRAELVRIIPSAAWLVPSAGPKLTVALAALNPFTLWSFALLGLGLAAIAKVGRGLSFGVAAVAVFGGLIFAVPFAK